MEFGPILSTILRNRLSALLVASQIAITMAVLCNASFLAADRLQTIMRPTGMDVGNIFAADVINFGDAFDARAEIPLDIAALEAIDGVRAVTTINAAPLSGSGSGIDIRTHQDAEHEDSRSQIGNIYMVDTQGIETLGVNLIAGRNFSEAEMRWLEPREQEMPPVMIVTQSVADSLFPDGDALGQVIYWRNQPKEIIGIVELMFGSWVQWEGVANSMLVPARGTALRTQFLIRTEPGQRDRVMGRVDEVLTDRYAERVVRNIISMEDFKENSYSSERTTAVVLVVIVGLLLTVTGLGIVGLVSFLVGQRTKQIGTRRALGAQRWHVVRYFLIENWLITSIGLSLGLILTSLLNYYLVQNFELPRLPLTYLPIGLMGIWTLSLLASFGPARRAARVSPAIATRTV